MSTKSMNNTGIKTSFNQLYEQLTEKDRRDNEARILMFRFLSIVDAKREELGWSRKDLAKKINTSPAFVSQLFRGDKLINLTTLATLQQVMGFEFEIVEKRTYAGKIISYDPDFADSPNWIYGEQMKDDTSCIELFPLAV